jgi:DNA repair protein RecN (Recombination protein N)
MLNHLSINNFTLVDSLEIELKQGLSVLTGETGAGKSILLDALGLALGDRGDGDRVRTGQPRAEISAEFDISDLKAAQRWLADNDLDAQDQCLLRRVITAEGRSRGFINGQAVTMAQLRELGGSLIDIHGQHEHQQLLRKDHHRLLLDDYGGLQPLAKSVKDSFDQWHQVSKHLLELTNQNHEHEQRVQLLSFQVQELDELGLAPGELDALENEQKVLANAEDSLRQASQIEQLISSEEMGLEEQLRQALHRFSQLPHKTPALLEAEELLTNADIQVQEACQSINQHLASTEVNPQRLQEVDDRLGTIYQCARKHRVQPSELLELHQRLSDELDAISGGTEKIEALQAQEAELRSSLEQLAANLTSERQQTAKKLVAAVNKQLKKLAMANAQVELAITAQEINRTGADNIELLVSTNPGAAPKALAKVASGGELSRISLAIVVVTAKTSKVPTLVFDEVDVGIGGAVADEVGNLLRSLGSRGQVLCVTHLGQVAAKAHQHWQVTKHQGRKHTSSTIIELTGEDKVAEIARMIGGAQSDEALAHAQALIESA